MKNKIKSDVESTRKNGEDSKSIQRSRDSGSVDIPHMEQYIKLIRKVRHGGLVCQLIESIDAAKAAPISQAIGNVDSGLSIKHRNLVFRETSAFSEEVQAKLESISERVNLLCDEPGAQIVSEMLDPQEQAESTVLGQNSNRYARALFLYLRQEIPSVDWPRDNRFEQAEVRHVLVQQAGQQRYSSHFMGPKGIVPVLDDEGKNRVIQTLLSMFPNVNEQDIVVDVYETSTTIDGVKVPDSVVWAITFNGKNVHYQYVANGEVEEVDTTAASCIRFNWSVNRGTLGVYCEEMELRSELAMMFRDIGMSGQEDIKQMPIWEFDLSGFSTPTILPRLKIHRIEGIEAIEIRSLTLYKPEVRSSFSQGREINRRIENSLVIKRHRFEERDIYEVAKQIHRIHDLSGYVVSQVKLGVRIAKTSKRSAHSVSVQVSIPNGFADESKTKSDSALILQQLLAVGCATQF